MKNIAREKKITPLIVLISLALMALWSWGQFTFGANTNAAWLTIAAGRLIAGGRMVDEYYETNLPLSVWLYLPSAILTGMLNVPLKHAVFFYALCFSGFSIAATKKILGFFEGIESVDRSLFVLCYAIFCLVLPGYFFGDREHIIFMALMPLCLALLCPDIHEKTARIFLASVIVLCSFIAAVKPPFLLFPMLAIIVQVASRRTMSWALSYRPVLVVATVLACTILVAVFHADYLTLILPDMAVLYISGLWNSVTLLPVYELSLLVAGVFILSAFLPSERRAFVQVLLAASLGCLGIAALQGKGFYYHFIPAMILLGCGTALVLFQALEKRKIRGAFGLAVLFSLIISYLSYRDVYSYFLYPPIYAAETAGTFYRWPAHEHIQNTALVKTVARYAGKNPYFVLGSMPAVIEPAVYTGAPYGSRFPTLWFLPSLLRAEQEKTWPAATLEAYKKKYAVMIREDFVKFKPKVVILGDLYFTRDQKDAFDFGRYFSIDPGFRKLWEQYKKMETIKLNSRDYYGGYMYGVQDEYGDYGVYVRQEK